MKKAKRGKPKGYCGGAMVSFRVTEKMRRNAPPDNYTLTEEERQAIVERNKKILLARKKYK